MQTHLNRYFRIRNASCFSSGVPWKSVKVILAGKSCFLWEVQGFQTLVRKASGWQDTITSLLHTSNSRWSPLVTFAAPRTISRCARGCNHTSFGVGVTTWIKKHVLEPSTRVFATWMSPSTSTSVR